MKIAMLGHKRIPTREGGVELVVRELSTRMAALGNDVTAYNRHCGEPKLTEYEKVHIVEIPTSKKSSLNAMIYSVFATLHLVFHRYDVVHYHAEGPCAMLPIAKLFGKHTVATIHGLDWQRAKWGGLATRYLLFGEKMAARHADELIVLSRAMQQYFKDTYNRESTLIPNGVNRVTPLAPNLIRQYGVEGRDYILFLARLTPEKGLHYLIEAFRATKTDKKLLIAGRLTPATPYVKEIQQMAAADDRIVLLDFVQGDLLAELFSNCYLYVLPSDIEGMPLSLLEAISYHARVLVSDIPENTAFLQNYGHSFAKGSVPDLTQKLADLLAREASYDSDFRDNVTAQETEAQIAHIVETYDWDEITKQTLALYEKK